MKVLGAGLLAACLAAAGPAAAQVATQVATYHAKGPFDFVKDDLVGAIQARGLVIDHTSHIGAMLDRTGKDVGSSKRIFEEAQALQFCSAVVSRRMMESKPGNIAYCPYVIALYTLPGQKDTVHVTFRRGLPEVDELLEAIVRDALGLKK